MRNANLIRNKAVTAQEMIVHISQDLMTRIGDPVTALLQEINVSTTSTELAHPNCIQWSRKVDRIWDTGLSTWKPCDLHVELEPFVLILLDQFEFAMAVKEGIAQYHASLKQRFPSSKIIYVIEDIQKYYADKKAVVGRAFGAILRADGPARLSKKSQQRISMLDQLPSRAEIEAQLLWLQMQSRGDVFIHHVTKKETPSWIKTFTVEISQIPEWQSRNEESFNVQFGDSVKSGKGLSDTWQRMLQCIQLVTEARALAVVSNYPTFKSLFSAYQSCNSTEGASLLAHLKVCMIYERMRLTF